MKAMRRRMALKSVSLAVCILMSVNNVPLFNYLSLCSSDCYALAPESSLVRDEDHRPQLSTEFLIQYLLNKIKVIRKEGVVKEYEIRLRLGKYLYELNVNKGTRVEMLERDNWLEEFGDLYIFKVRGETISFFAVKGTDDVFYFPGARRTIGDVHAVLISALSSHSPDIKGRAFIALAGTRTGRESLIAKVLTDEALFVELYSLQDEWIAQTLAMWERIYIFLKYVAGLSLSKFETDPYLIREFMDKMFKSGVLESDVRAIAVSIQGKYGADQESLSEYLMYRHSPGKSSMLPVRVPNNVIRDMLGELSRFDLSRALRLEDLYVEKLEDGEIAGKIDGYMPKTHATGKPVPVNRRRLDMASKVNVFFEEGREILRILVDVRREVNCIKSADPYVLNVEAREQFYDFRKYYHNTISEIDDLDILIDIKSSVLSFVKPVIVLSLAFTAGNLASWAFTLSQLDIVMILIGTVYVFAFHFNKTWMEVRTVLNDAFVLPEGSIPEMLMRAHMFLPPMSISDAEPEISLIKQIIYSEKPDYKKFYRRYYELIFAEHKSIYDFNSTHPSSRLSAIDFLMRTFVAAPRIYRIAVRNLLAAKDQDISEKDIKLSIDFLYHQARMGSPWAFKILSELQESPDVNDDIKMKLAAAMFRIRNSKESYIRMISMENMYPQENYLSSSL